MTTDPDLTIIDELGVQVVADALEISREAVRKWRIKRTIPDHRREELRNLTADLNDGSDDGQPGWPTSTTSTLAWLPLVVGQTPTVESDQLIDLETVAGLNAVSKAEEVIAERDARLAGQQASALSAAANDGPQDSNVRSYGFRLAGLFALDFPVLTMAFVAVAQVSPIVAAGSAIALSLFLVLGAHLLGGVLRAASGSIPIWCRHIATLIVLISFLVAIVWVTLDLRLKGLEFEGLISTTSNKLVFGDSNAGAVDLHPSFELAIGRAAALVTIGSLLFGIAWSYRQHGPASARMKAELAYRRNLRRLARRRVKLARLERRAKKVGTAAVIMVLILTSISRPGHAVTCDGSTVLALIDTTTAYDDVDRANIMPIIERMAGSLVPGQRLILRTVRDAAHTSRLLLDGCVPPDPATSWSVTGIWTWLTSNPSVLRTDRDTFFTKMRDALFPQLRSHGETSRSALVGTLKVLADNTVDDIPAMDEIIDTDAEPCPHPNTFPPGERCFRFKARPEQPDEKVSIDDRKCFACHSTRNVLNDGTTPGTTGNPIGAVKFKSKPNWDTYDSWGGMLAFNRDRIYKGSIEAATFRKLMNLWTWQTNEAVRSVIEQLELQPSWVTDEERPKDRIERWDTPATEGGENDGHIRFAFDPPFPTVEDEPLPTGVPLEDVDYRFDRLSPNGTPSTVVRNDDFVVLQHSDPDSPTRFGDDEGRGTNFFNNLYLDLNPQRIVDEISPVGTDSHIYATGSVPIDVRPIALAIAEGCISVAPDSNITSTQVVSGVTVPPFFAARNGMNFNDVFDDTRRRAQSTSRRKADIQKLNLDRTGDIYVSGVDPAEGLIDMYEAGTDGLVPALPGETAENKRLRQLRQGCCQRNLA